jgi:hypothetical protein
MATCGRVVIHEMIDGELHTLALRCKRWNCPWCGPRKRAELVELGIGGQPNAFLTLTCAADKFASPDEGARALVWGFQQLLKMVKARWPRKHVEFLAVFEKHKSKWPHLHVLLRGGYLPQAWISQQMRALIGSPIVDIRGVSRPTEIAHYIAKYVSKNPEAFKGCRRFWRSRGWLLKRPSPKAKVPPRGERRVLVGYTGSDVVQRLFSRGWRVKRNEGSWIVWGTLLPCVTVPLWDEMIPCQTASAGQARSPPA